MTQALYAHMNNKRKNKFLKKVSLASFLLLLICSPIFRYGMAQQ
jgi:hypothetical protein